MPHQQRSPPSLSGHWPQALTVPDHTQGQVPQFLPHNSKIHHLWLLIRFHHSDPEASSKTAALKSFNYGKHARQEGLPRTLVLPWQQAECSLTIHIGDANKLKYGDDDKGVGGSIGVHKLEHVDPTLGRERNSHYQIRSHSQAPSPRHRLPPEGSRQIGVRSPLYTRAETYTLARCVKWRAGQVNRDIPLRQAQKGWFNIFYFSKAKFGL